MPYGCIVYIKTDDIYKDIAEDVETRYDTSKTVWLIVKTYSYLIDDGIEDKKAKNAKQSAVKRKLKFKNYKDCLKLTELENKINNQEKKRN